MTLDELLAQRAAGGAAAAPAAASAAPTGTVQATDLDSMLSARASGAQVAQAPAESPPRGFLGQARDLMVAGAHHAASLPWAAGQLVSNAVAAPFRLAPDNAVSRAVIGFADDSNHIINNRESSYQASTPNSGGAYLGATVGSVAPMLIGGVGGGLQRAGEAVGGRVAAMLPKAIAPLAGKVVSGAAQGAVMGAAQPVAARPLGLADLVVPREPEPGFWEQKAEQTGLGAAFGGALPAAAAPIGAAWNAGRRGVANSSILNPSNYAARQVGIQLGADAPAVADALANPAQHVKGSVPTAAQAGANTKLVMMEKALANQSPEFKAQLAARENANNAARIQAVSEIAQTPEALAEAVAQRNARTAPMRDFTVTNGNPVPVSGVQGAVSSVANGPLGVNKTIGPAAREMQSEIGSFTNTIPADTLMNTPGSATASPSMLDALRQNANTYLAKYAPTLAGPGTQEQAAMVPVKQSIISAINDANPGHKLPRGGWGQGLEQAGPEAPSYRDYLSEFAKQSVPINTMQVGQEVQGKLAEKALNSGGDPMATLTNYRSALAAALNRSEYGIDPAAKAQLEAIQQDLQRSTISNSVRAGSGSDTAYNAGAGSRFLKALGAQSEGNAPAAIAGAGALAATGSTAAAAGAAVGAKKAAGMLTNRVQNALGELLLDPQKLAEALQAASKPLATTAPSAFGRLTASMAPAAKAALIGELLKAQAPQVIGANPQRANAYQP